MKHLFEAWHCGPYFTMAKCECYKINKFTYCPKHNPTSYALNSAKHKASYEAY